MHLFPSDTVNIEESSLTNLKDIHFQNPKNIIFSYPTINLTHDKFDSLGSLVSSLVDILSIAETKLNHSFPNAMQNS